MHIHELRDTINSKLSHKPFPHPPNKAHPVKILAIDNSQKVLLYTNEPHNIYFIISNNP